MFPRALAKQFERLFARILNRLLVKNVNKIIKDIGKDPDFKTDSIEDIIEKLNGFKQQFGRFANTKSIQKVLEKDFKQFDAWAKSRIELSLRRSIKILKNRQFRQKAVGSESIMKRVLNGITLQESGVTKQALAALVKTNVNLIKTIGQESFPDIEDKIREGLQKGLSTKSITKNIQKAVKVTESRAKFWARDQAAKAVSKFTETRQKEAGIEGFIWRTLKDERVRGNPGGEFPDAENPHWDQEGKFFTWKEGWRAPDGRTLFPGIDYNCRCFAEPALGAEQATA